MNLAILFATLLIAIMTFMSIWFAFAVYVKRIDAVDSAWGLGFVYLALIVFFSEPSQYSATQRLAVILVGIWGLRLAVHITRRNVNKPEDQRYAVYREKWGGKFLQKAYTNIYILQGLLILIISTPVIAIENTSDQQWKIWSTVGFIVWGLGIIIEVIADAQLQRFLKHRKGKAIMQSGLWRYSRHPNYFGEITTWVGAGIVSLGLERWWGAIGPVVIALLIIKVSGIPPLEKHYKGNRAYQKYAKRTSILIPLPPKQ